MLKLPNTSISIFTVMSKMANEYHAINLSQGFPNFPIDVRMTDIVTRLAKTDIHQYAPMAGYPPLLEKIAQLTLEHYQRKVNPSTEILITAGATEAIFATIQAFVQPQDEVIILDPSYDCYEMPIILSNAKPIRIALKDDYSPDFDLIKKHLSSKTRMLILNNPHNPSGKIWTEHDFIQLEKIIENFPNLLILSDEVYEFITFENKHISINTREKLKERSLIVSSFGKTLHLTGWKIGYLIAPEHLLKEVKKVHQYLVFSVNSLAQASINEYLTIFDVHEVAQLYLHKRNFFQNLLKETAFDLLPCEGTYFQTASYQNISDEKDLDFTKRLVTEFGVATIPLSVFYKDKTDLKRIRFCFAKEDELLMQATERLIKIKQQNI
ncbi:aminotransferase class I/II-fold pyridoxal phosphate-dependent enzyme [Flavobacterium piscinae]|uniref:methionine aminotransferase n=1 Tax=Flavobacterium piscinae TaxID=2506424 RepID=UPI0019965A17|nr:methionine aminotransferase [Flavobacterium piscinae]MBC8883042.1 aminotransferase class I/II-fold pyridoxal phosphate-dependent enzyme [Flavobacterium piscinae]